MSSIDFDLERSWAAEVLLDDCTIVRSGSGEPTFDETLGRSVAASVVTVWAGKCSVSYGSSDRTNAEIQGERSLVLGVWVVRIPIEVTEAASGDVVRIDAVRPGGDPALVGRRFVVRRVGARSSAVLRRLFCDELVRTTP